MLKKSHTFTLTLLSLLLVACDKRPYEEHFYPPTAVVDQGFLPGEVLICSNVALEHWDYLYDGSDRLSQILSSRSGPEIFEYSEAGDVEGSWLLRRFEREELSLQLSWDREKQLLSRVLSVGSRENRWLFERHEEELILHVDLDPELLLSELEISLAPSLPPQLDASFRLPMNLNILLLLFVEQNAEERLLFSERQRLDEQGSIKALEWDLAEDGVVDARCLISKEGERELRRCEGLGEDYVHWTEHDSQGRLLEQRDFEGLHRYEYLEEGILKEEHELVEEEIELLRLITRTPVQILIRDDLHRNGSIDRSTLIQLNAHGERVRKQEDHNMDTLPDWQKIYSYDEEGRRRYEERDQTMDGSPDQRWDYRWDGDLLVREIRSEPAAPHCVEELGL